MLTEHEHNIAEETDYHVEWHIDVTATDAHAAAKEAWGHMRKPDTTANVFDVSDGNKTFRVDLQDDSVTEI